MKRFLISVAAVAVFFLGLGALVEKTGASFKSDERALELIRKARQAIGGDQAVTAVRSMTIKGRTTVLANINGAERQETGETEIALQFPNKLTRSVKIGDGNAAGPHVMDRQFDVIVMGDKAKVKTVQPLRTDSEGDATISKKIVIKKDDGSVQELTGADADAWIAAHPNVPGEKQVVIRHGDGGEITAAGKAGENIILRRSGSPESRTVTTADGKTFTLESKNVVLDKVVGTHAAPGRSNELLRTALSLLLTAPEGLDVAYTYGGESTLDGVACNVVVASFGGESFKLYLDRSSDMPVGMVYTGVRTPRIIAFNRTAPAPDGAAGDKDVVMFRKIDAAAAETAEFQVRFSDYRSVGSVQLPFRWVQTAGGKADETFEITNYELNPANIAEKFSDQKVFVRTAKPATK